MATAIAAQEPHLTPTQFLSLDPHQFRCWLEENDLMTISSVLPTNSELKPSDLLEIIFDDGPTGLKAILQDEVIEGTAVKLIIVARLRSKFSKAADLRRPVDAPSPTPDAATKTEGPFLGAKTSWSKMVAENKKRASKTPNARALAAEVAEGREYVFSVNCCAHGMWFNKSPEGACSLIEGIEFRRRTSTVVARGQTKEAYVLFCTGDFLAAVIKTKSGANSTYTATAGAVLDPPTFWGIIGRAYTENKKNQVAVDKALAKKYTPDALIALRGLEIKRSSKIHDEIIGAAEKERGVLESAAADGDVNATSKLRKKTRQYRRPPPGQIHR